MEATCEILHLNTVLVRCRCGWAFRIGDGGVTGALATDALLDMYLWHRDPKKII